MKQFILLLISLYQYTLSVFIKNVFGNNICRFSPSCSEYAKKSISKYGVFKGIYISARRISSCQPFNI